jgi:RimJ/RimL family protein N-acetyltransferase
MGRTVIIIWVLAENKNAIKFYEKCGFVADGGKRIWQYGKPLEGIRMRRVL